MGSETPHLNLLEVNDHFQQSLVENDDVDIDKYLKGYKELIKFLNLIGTMFSFVSSDVKSKIKIMEKHCVGDDFHHYVSFRDMMEFEKDTGLHEKNGFVSGSRTMLRLHRGLDFIKLFLRGLSESDNQSSTNQICNESYSQTLAIYHPWYIRKAATLAMLALPSKPDLLRKVFGSELNLNNSLAILPETLNSCDEVFRRVDSIYTELNFHDLP